MVCNIKLINYWYENPASSEEKKVSNESHAYVEGMWEKTSKSQLLMQINKMMEAKKICFLWITGTAGTGRII